MSIKFRKMRFISLCILVKTSLFPKYSLVKSQKKTLLNRFLPKSLVFRTILEAIPLLWLILRTSVTGWTWEELMMFSRTLKIGGIRSSWSSEGKDKLVNRAWVFIGSVSRPKRRMPRFICRRERISWLWMKSLKIFYLIDWYSIAILLYYFINTQIQSFRHYFSIMLLFIF